MKAFILLLTLSLYWIHSAGQPRFSAIKTIGDSGSDAPGIIETDSGNNTYITGSFVGSITLGSTTLSSIDLNTWAIFAAKVDPAGNYVWAKKLYLSNPNLVDYSVVDHVKMVIRNGKAYLLHGVNYNGGIGSYLSIFRALDGAPVDTINLSGSYADIDVDSAGNMYLVTNSGGTITASAYSHYAKYDSLGNKKWGYYTPPGNEGSNIQYRNGIVSIVGQFRATMQFADTVGSSPITVNSTGGINDWDLYKVQYSANGQLLSVLTTSGNIPGSPSGNLEYSAGLSPTGKLHLAWGDANGAQLIRFSNTLTSLATATIPISNCFSPLFVMKTSLYSEESLFTYYGLACNAGNIFRLDTAMQIIEQSEFPYVNATSSNYVPVRSAALSIDSVMYITGGFAGSFQCGLPSGSTTVSSNANSPDIFFGPLHVCFSQATLTASGDTLKAGPSGYFYKWYLNGVLITGTNPTLATYVATQSGTYTVRVDDSLGCTDTSSALALIVSNVIDIDRSKVMLHPNPVTNELCIDGVSPGTPVQILDINGRVLQTKEASKNGLLDVSQLQKGLYFIRLRTKVGKFVKL